jgi:hypothetical protein
MSLGTPWGLSRHYWVLISLVLTVFCTVVLLLHMPSVSALASVARQADNARLATLGGDLMHPGIGLLVLLAITVLNMYKPAGLTPYGWRKQYEGRQSLQGVRRVKPAVTPIPLPRVDGRQRVGLSALWSGVGSFLAHFAEMFFAMMAGMMIFMPVGLGLTALGDTALLNAGSIEFEVWMAVFMVAPMVAWMRARGCRWRLGAEMASAMLLPVAGILALRSLGLGDRLPWLANSEHTAMVLGMLAAMLYRRDHYTSGYSLIA